jgi:hypothetical protein
MRGRTKNIHKELQDLGPEGSPHLEEKVIGGNIDLDLLSLFPEKDARIMGGKEGEGKLSKSKMEVRETQFVPSPRRKKGYLYPLQICDRWGH